MALCRYGSRIGLIVGVFGDRIEKWAESFPFIPKDGWISTILPGVIAGIIGGLALAAILFVISKLNTAETDD